MTKQRVNNKLVLAAATVLSLTALPALADVHFSFGTYFGDEPYHHGYHEGFERHEFMEHRWHHPHWYGPRPVVFMQPEPVIVERRVYVEEPEIASASPGRVVSSSPYCREYQRTVNVGGHRQESYGTACRQPDGAWKIISE